MDRGQGERRIRSSVNMTRWEKMNINPDVVRIKAEVKEAFKQKFRIASKRKFRIERPDNKKRAKIARDDKRSSALETVVPIGEAGIRCGFDLNMEACSYTHLTLPTTHSV